MLAAYLPGYRNVDLRHAPDPAPTEGQILLAMKASTICGSDLRAIYREHLGEGPEAYRNVVGGHEPAGQAIALGLAAGLLAKAMGVSDVIGADPSPERRELAESLGAVTSSAPSIDGAEVDASIDCSGVGAGQLAALQNTRRWGRVASWVKAADSMWT